MNKMEILIGMIASGKSTYCKEKAKEGYLIVNDDAIVNAVHGGNYLLYDKKLKPLYKIIENTICSIGILAGKSIIIDRGLNIRKQSRSRFISLAKSFDIECEAIIFQNEGPEVHAKRRFESDSRGVSYEKWLERAKFHNDNFNIPSLSEGFNIITHVITSIDK